MALSDRSKTFLTIGLVLLVVLLLLGLAEGTVRVRQWFKYGHFGQLDTVYEVDAKTNLRVPVAHTRTRNIQINSLGFRGPEIEVPKPSDTLRLAFLGASTTFCAEASRNEFTWPHLVAEQIQAVNDAIVVDYVNAGVPGYTVRSSLRNLKERVAPLDPDIIFVYHATNDLSVETRAMAAEQGVYRQDSTRESWLSQYSLLWFLVEKNLRIATLQHDAQSARGRLEFTSGDLGAGFRADLTDLVREATEVAKLVVLVTFSHRIRNDQAPDEQANAAASALYYMPFMTPQGLYDAFARYNEIIRDVADQTGVFLVGGELDIPADGAHFNDTVHFKDAGSRFMAQRIVQRLGTSPSFKKMVNEVSMQDR